MITIYKYPFPKTDDGFTFGYKFQLPELSELLYCDGQDDQLYLWAKIDDSLPLTTKQVYVVGTGWQVPENIRFRYINTIQFVGLVYHFFERL